MSNSHKIYIEFPGRILFVGFGSIGQGTLPLLLRHVGIAPERLTIVAAEDKGADEADKSASSSSRSASRARTSGAC